MFPWISKPDHRVYCESAFIVLFEVMIVTALVQGISLLMPMFALTGKFEKGGGAGGQENANTTLQHSTRAKP